MVPEKHDRRGTDRRQHDRRKEDRQKRRRFDPKILIILAAIGAIVFLWIQRNRREVEMEEAIRPPVSVVYPEQGTIRRTFRISGYVETENMVTVLPKISGTMTELHIDVGDKVSEGEVIAEIDSAPYLLTLRQAEAGYYAAKSTYERMKVLYNSNATSKQNYDQAKSQYDAAKSQYELAKLNYEYTRVTSPVDGVVLIKHASRGSLVAQQVPIVTIGDLEHLMIKAKIPEKYYAFFANKGKEMEIEAELPALEEKNIEALIKTVSPYISPETKNFETECRLTGETSLLRPGMFVYLTFVLDKRIDIYHLPFDVLVGGDTLWHVNTEDCTATRMEFEPSFYNNDLFQIPSDYTGIPFIFEGQHFLKEGQVCNVVNKPGLCGKAEEE